MKKITFLLVALMATFSVFTAKAQNLVVNGSFEGDAVGAEPASWTAGSKDVALVSDLFAQDGVNSATSVGATAQMRLEQLVPVVAGKTYTFSFYYTGDVADAIKNYSLNGLASSDGYMDDGQPAVPVTAVGTWGMYSKTFVANFDKVSISLRLYKAAYIDNISLVANASDTTVVDTTVVDTTVAVTTVANIAEFIAAANTTDLVTISGEVLVNYANEYTTTSSTGSNIYVSDASGAILIYGHTLTNLVAGDKLTGLQGKFSVYNGTNQVIEAVIPTAVASTAPSATLMLPEDLIVADQSKLVRIENVTITSETSGTYTNQYANSVGGGKVQIYDKFKTGLAVEDGKVYNIEGIVVIYNGSLEIAQTVVEEVGGSSDTTVVATTVANIAEFIATANTTDLVAITGSVLVSYANEYTTEKGDNSSVYLTDASGAILMYGHTFTNLVAGDKLTGLQGKFSVYNGTNQVIEAVIPTAVASTAPSATLMLPEDLIVADQSKLVRIENVTITSETSGTYTNQYANSVGGGKVQIYDKFKTGLAVEDGKVYNIEGIVVIYNGSLEIAQTVVEEVGGSSDTTVVATTVANIAEFIATANTTDLVAITGSVLVSYANEYTTEKGDNSSVYLTDASGAILMYGHTFTHLMAGDKLTGLQGKYASYKGTHELVSAVIPAAVASSAPSPMVMLPENMTVADQSKYVRLEELTISSEVSGEYTNLYGNSVGGGKIMIYDKFKTGIAVEEGKSYDMEGIVVLFNDGLELAYTSAIETGNGVVNTVVNSVFFDGATIINPNKVAINVYSITGQLVVSGNDNINMNDYNTGVYIVTTPQGVIKISK